MRGTLGGMVAAGAALLLAAGARGAGEGAARAPRRDRVADEAFLKTVWHALAVGKAQHFDAVYDKIDWGALAQGAAKAPDADERARRRRLISLWQVLARLHDFGRMCAAPNVFESKALLLLKGDAASLRTVRKALGRFEEPKDAAFDPAPFRRYLATEPLPPWAVSLRVVAAAVIAGEGDREGMRRLVEVFRASLPRDAGGRALQARGLPTAVVGAHTEAALPLWADVLQDKQEAVRTWAVQNVARVHSERAEPLLIERLADQAYAVRREAALKLMARERRESIPVLQEALRRDLDGGMDAALKAAAVCCALERWGVADVPWPQLEGLLTEAARGDDSAHWRAITLAGHCLSAGRTDVAVPFLKQSLEARHEELARHAAHTLLKNGSGLGIEPVALHVATGTEKWSEAYEDLLALAAFLAHGKASSAETTAVRAIARQAWERRRERAYAFRIVEALGQMGMLVGVSKAEGGLTLTTAIDIRYEAAGRRKRIPLVTLVKARLASVAASAKQDGIALPPAFLARCRRDELAALEALTRGADPNLAREAAETLKAIAEAEERE